MDIVKIDEKHCKGKKPDYIVPDDCWIMGGAVRSWYSNEPLKDIDVFAKSSSKLEEFIEANGMSPKGNPSKYLLGHTDITDTYRIDGTLIQIIKIHHPSVEEFFKIFDFTLCQFAFDGKDLWASMEAIIAVERKHLAVNELQSGYEVDSLRRAFKYAEKGYKPCLGTINDLAHALALNGLTEEDLDMQKAMSSGGMTTRWD